MAINKRLRYFSTEEEYQKFYEQQRQACDAGTLELLETTVCCITHGDIDTPDEYLPSHEPGDEEVIMHYNVNDDIRYIPFINPMWTIRGLYLSEVSGGGYQPVPTKSGISLPEVIDGNQLTELRAVFTQNILNFPSFNVKNVSIFEYQTNKDLNVPSDWPSLTELHVSRVIRIGTTYDATAPVFQGGVLNAAMLRVVNYNFSGGGYHKIQDLPLINSSVVESLLMTTRDAIINISNILSSTINLSTILLQAATTSGIPQYDTHTIILKYDGEHLSWSYAGLNGLNANRNVAFNITGNLQNIDLSTLYLYECDLGISTFADITLPNNLYFVNCDNSIIGRTVQKNSWLSVSGDTIQVDAPQNIIRFNNCQWDTYIIDINSASTATRWISVQNQPTGLPEIITVNVNTDNQSFRIEAAGEQAEGININIASDINTVNQLSIYAPADWLDISDNQIVAQRVFVRYDMLVSTKLDWYKPYVSGQTSTYSFSSSDRTLKLFRLHAAQPSLNIGDTLDSLDLEVLGFPSTTGSYLYLDLNIQEEVLASNITFQQDASGLTGLSVRFNSGVSVQTINRILTSVNPAFDFTEIARNRYLRIYQTQYDEIAQDYPSILAIINKFDIIDIVTI